MDAQAANNGQQVHNALQAAPVPENNQELQAPAAAAAAAAAPAAPAPVAAAPAAAAPAAAAPVPAAPAIPVLDRTALYPNALGKFMALCEKQGPVRTLRLCQRRYTLTIIIGFRTPRQVGE